MEALLGPNKVVKARAPWQIFALVGFVVVAFILGRSFGVMDDVAALREWILAQGLWGVVIFIALFAAGVVLAVPGTALTIMAGALFGSVLGVVVTSISATVGAAAAFVIGRYVAREPLARWMRGKERFERIDQLTGEHGAVMVAFVRLIPIVPLNMENYVFGLTKVSFRTYLFWSWLCMLPSTIVYVVGADAVVSSVERGSISWTLVVVAVAAVVISIAAVWYAKRLLTQQRVQRQRELDDQSTAGEPVP